MKNFDLFLLYWPRNFFLYSSALEKKIFSKADAKNLTLLYWLGNFFLYIWWVEKNFFSTPDENSQIFWLGSGIFHLLVPLVHFHLQYRNEIFIQDYYLFELLDQLHKQTNKNIPIWRYSFQHEVIFHLFVPKGSHTGMLEFSWLVCISFDLSKIKHAWAKKILE